MLTPLNISLDRSGNWDFIFCSRICIQEVDGATPPDRLWWPVKWELYSESWNLNTGVCPSSSFGHSFGLFRVLVLRTTHLSIATKNATVPTTTKASITLTLSRLPRDRIQAPPPSQTADSQEKEASWSFLSVNSQLNAYSTWRPTTFPHGMFFTIPIFGHCHSKCMQTSTCRYCSPKSE